MPQVIYLISVSGKLSQTTMVVVIVVSVLIVILVCVGCIAWRFWRKRKAAVQSAAKATDAEASVNAKQLDSVDPVPKHCAGAKARAPEIIINFVATKQTEKNTNKTQEKPMEEKKHMDKDTAR